MADSSHPYGDGGDGSDAKDSELQRRLNGEDQIICEEENQLSLFQIVGIVLLRPLSHRYAP